jgi:AraC-like DNA-binding protein
LLKEFKLREDEMSYDRELLFNKISSCLREKPCSKLDDLSQCLRVSRQTIQNVVSVSTGRTFKRLREEIFLAHVRHHFGSKPTLSIKELSFCMGFKSASSFARVIRRTCGFTPEELRSHIAREVITAQSLKPAAHIYDSELLVDTQLPKPTRQSIQSEPFLDE